jgi:hypothetical protein
LSTGIKVQNSKNIYIRGGSIAGFNKGIEAINSDVIINNTTFQRCNVAIDLTNSEALINNPIFVDNIIDITVNKSDAKLINTLTNKILAITPQTDIRINPYVIEQMGLKVINTRDVAEKKKRFRELLKYLKYYTHIWAIYSILKEIARLAGYNI